MNQKPSSLFVYLVGVIWSISWCSNNAHLGVSAEATAPTCEVCNLYSFDNTWVLAGRSYGKNETIGFPNDVVLQNITHQSSRGFPGWNRYYHLHSKGKPNQLTYAPAIEWPFECHDRLYNAQVNPTTFIITADRPIAPLEPIFLECWNDDFAVDILIDDFPNINNKLDMETVQEYGRCLDDANVQSIDNNDNDNSQGVFAKRTIPKDNIVASGKLIHMHRAELYNETTRTFQELIEYTYGHPSTDVLLLPNFPLVSSIRHGRPANVQLVWDNDDDIEDILQRPSDIQFAEYESSMLWGAIVALRELSVGEELLLDYGDAHVLEQQFPPTQRHERSVPDGFFPESWLAHETRHLASQLPRFALPKLQPGQVQPLTLQDGSTKLSDHQHRVGFPSSVADTMQEWAQHIGLLDHLKRYVTDKPLPVDGEERVRINNATWWTKRFNHEWASNMHYIATDSDESTEQMFVALGRGGFDTVLDGIGRYFNWTQVTCFYPSYIVVNHCVKSHVHSDSDLPHVKNLIFPVLQVPGSDPELILAEDDSLSTYVPYKYEREAGILLGKDGMHGTAPTDYRDSGGVRIVVSVYMADFSKDDEDLHEFIRQWQDPPYPTYYPGQLHHHLTKRIHWHKDDPSISVGDPLPRAFPLSRPKPKPMPPVMREPIVYD